MTVSNAVLQEAFKQRCGTVHTYASLMIERRKQEDLAIKNGVLDPPNFIVDQGLQVTVHMNGGIGYAATGDLSERGVNWAFDRAEEVAKACAGWALWDSTTTSLQHAEGQYESEVQQDWWALSLSDKISLLKEVYAAFPEDDRRVYAESSVLASRTERAFYTSQGGAIHQIFDQISPDLTVILHGNGHSQRRSFGLRGRSQQGGAEHFDVSSLQAAAVRLLDEARALLDAPICPTDTMDLILDAEQMMLQVHESIGHPLELDRILGDERNYAGRSFVTQDMFGHYQYGSPHLNITFNPSLQGEFASYAFDDQGTPAEKVFLIKEGILQAPLGGTLSQSRANISGVACTRTQRWNRPPIDRMANLNLEPGDQSLMDLISGVERGIYMMTNQAWSIDDSRNKFQFGCELGRLIEDGELKGYVRNPNYRGVSSTFWRALSGVGDQSTFEVLGTPYCGKGEPNQVISVGHAVPACRFSAVEVFGGAS